MNVSIDDVTAQMMDALDQQYRTQLEERDIRIQELMEQLSVYSDGNQIKREDYEALEQRLRNEQNDHMQESRILRELESKLQTANSKIEALEYKLQRQNSDVNTGVQIAQAKDNEIKQLKMKLDRQEGLILKSRQDMLNSIQEKKLLNDSNRRFKAHIDDLDKAIEELLSRNKVLTTGIGELNDRVNQLQADLNDKEYQLAQYDTELSRAKRSDSKTGHSPQIVPRKQGGDNSYLEAQHKLMLANNQISELKAKISVLEITERRVAQLQTALEQRNHQLEALQEVSDQNQMELESYRSSVDEFNYKIQDYQEQLMMVQSNAELKIKAVTSELEYYRKQMDDHYNRNEEMEKKIAELNAELSQEKDRVQTYEAGIYGLPQAVQEIRQYKKMISIRDAHIGDMVNEINWYQKTISHLENVLPADFDFEEFYTNLEKAHVDDVQDKTEKRALSLLESTIARSQNERIGDIKIVLGAPSSPQKTIVLNTSQNNNEPVQPDFAVVTPASAAQDKGHKHKFKPKSKMETQEFTVPFSPETKSLPLPKNTKDQDTQTYGIDIGGSGISQENSLESMSETIPENDKLKEDFIHDMQRNMEILKRERMSHTQKMNIIKVERDNLIFETNKLKEKNEELIKENQHLKKKLKKIESQPPQPVSVLASSKSSQSSSSSDNEKRQNALIRPRLGSSSENSSSEPASPRRSHHGKIPPIKKRSDFTLSKNKRVYQRAPPELKMPRNSAYLELIIPSPPLSLFSPEESIIHKPTPEEEDVFNAQQNALKKEIDELHQQIAERSHSYENGENKIDQVEKEIRKKQETIENLEAQLKEQRAAFQERLLNYKNEAERYIETYVSQSREIDQLSNIKQTEHDVNEDRIEKLSQRQEELLKENDRLSSLLKRTQESYRMIKIKKENYKAKIRHLEGELAKKSEEPKSPTKQQDITVYANGLKAKLSATEDQVRELQAEVDELKRRKPIRYDPLSMSRKEKAVDQDSPRSPKADEPLRVRGMQIKMEEMRSKNEELQLVLGKANNTIERLNQLLSRKETQITNYYDRIVQMKQRIEFLETPQ